MLFSSHVHCVSTVFPVGRRRHFLDWTVYSLTAEMFCFWLRKVTRSLFVLFKYLPGWNTSWQTNRLQPWAHGGVHPSTFCSPQLVPNQGHWESWVVSQHSLGERQVEGHNPIVGTFLCDSAHRRTMAQIDKPHPWMRLWITFVFLLFNVFSVAEFWVIVVKCV